MTYRIVSDASCLIDLHKVDLLPAMLALPHQFAVLLTVRHLELLDLTDRQWRRLDDAGLCTLDLPTALVVRAHQVQRAHRRLSLNDCLCLVAVRHQDHDILLTGDRRLRRAAEVEGVRVHGVLWVIDQLHQAGVCGAARLTAALERWRDDPAVFLPEGEVQVRLQRLRRLVRGNGHVSDN